MTRQPTSPPQSSYPAAFDRAISRLLRDEGGYVNNPADPGGATRFGISHRDYPDLDISALTREQAIAIYYRDWWLRYGYADLPATVGAKLFDLAVNMGPANAGRCLQRALRACEQPVADDGVVGESTRAAAAAANQPALLAAFRSEAAGYYRALAAAKRADEEFLRGWLNRAYE